MSIRLRLTLLYSGILAVTLFAFGVGLYVAVSDVALGVATDALTAEAKTFATSFRPRPDPFKGELRIVVPPSALASQDSIQVRRLDGTVIFQSQDLQAISLTLPLDTLAQRRMQPRDFQPGEAINIQNLTSVGGKHVLVCTVPLLFQDTPVGILQVASALGPVDQTLDTLRRVAALGGGLVTLAGFGAGWLLAGTALRPIARITRTARAIGASRDFGRRVAYDGPPDEVGRLATTFNAMLTSLQEAYQAQRRFVADASHELRTPLTSIRGNLGLLQREPPIDATDRRAVLTDLVAESERLGRLVGDLLTLARTDADAGRQLRREPVPLAPLLADLARRLAMGHPGQTIRCEGADGVDAAGAPDAVTQVLLILLDNALKFTPPDGAVAVAVGTAGEQVSIAVRDTGPGIAPEVLPHIFERFYQVDTARAAKGTGLGLAIARALVEAMGGTIAVESHVGQGSTFTMILPRSPAKG